MKRKTTMPTPHRQRRPLSIVCFILSGLLGSACAYEWDGYDPRLAPVEPCVIGSSRICYAGPAATEGVGLCSSGEQQCIEGVWGPCVGEVLPVPEDCASAEDEDCDGATNDPEDGCSCQPGVTRACYAGPAGTEGVGLCKSGGQLCIETAAGNELGPCIGEVLPRPESCGTLQDDNCDGVANDHCAGWAVRFAGSAAAHSYDLASGKSGALLLAGDFTNNISIGGVLTGMGTDAFAAALTSTGQPIWAIGLSGADEQQGLAIKQDGLGDVVMAGNYSSELVVPGLVSILGSGSTDGFVVKLDEMTGMPLWVYTISGSGSDAALDVDVDDDNNIWVVGYYSGTVDFGDGPTAASSGRDGFIVKLTPDGGLIGKVVFGNSGNDEARGVAADAGEGVYVVGYFDEPVNIGGGALTDVGGDDGFVVKLDFDGNHIWSQGFGGDDDAHSVDVAVDPVDHSVVVLGHYATAVDLGGGLIGGTNSLDIFIAKYNKDGVYQWGHGYGDGAAQEPHALAIGPDANIYLVASLRGELLVGADNFRSAGEDDMLLLTHDAAGNPIWGRRFGTSHDQDLRGVAVDPMGNIVITGDCADTLDFGSGSLPGDTSKDDVCLASL